MPLKHRRGDRRGHLSKAWGWEGSWCTPRPGEGCPTVVLSWVKSGPGAGWQEGSGSPPSLAAFLSPWHHRRRVGLSPLPLPNPSIPTPLCRSHPATLFMLINVGSLAPHPSFLVTSASAWRMVILGLILLMTPLQPASHGCPQTSCFRHLQPPASVLGSRSLSATPASLGRPRPIYSPSGPRSPMSQVHSLLRSCLPLSLSGKTQPGPVLSSLRPHPPTHPFILSALPHPVSPPSTGTVKPEGVSWWSPTSHPLTSTQASVLPTLLPKPTWMTRHGFQGAQQAEEPPHLQSYRGSSGDGTLCT